MVHNKDYQKQHNFVGTGDYEVSFEYDVETSLLVEYTAADGDTYEKVLGVDYLVVEVGVNAYIRVLVDFGTGGSLGIYRDMPLTQTYNWIDGLDPSPRAQMLAIDRIVWQVQQVFGLVKGAISAPRNEDLNMTLPKATVRALGILGFDVDGNVTTYAGVPDVTVSSVMVPVVQASSTAAAKTALGFHISSSAPTVSDGIDGDIWFQY